MPTVAESLNQLPDVGVVIVQRPLRSTMKESTELTELFRSIWVVVVPGPFGSKKMSGTFLQEKNKMVTLRKRFMNRIRIVVRGGTINANPECKTVWPPISLGDYGDFFLALSVTM